MEKKTILSCQPCKVQTTGLLLHNAIVCEVTLRATSRFNSQAEILDQRNSLPMDNIPICWLVSNNAASLNPTSGIDSSLSDLALFLQGTVLCDSNLSWCSGDSESWSTTFAACAIHSRIVGPRTWDRLSCHPKHSPTPSALLNCV